MRLEPLKPGKFFKACDARCRSTAGARDIGIASARYRFWLLGRPTYLCHKCGPAWAKTYEDALHGFEDEVAA